MVGSIGALGGFRQGGLGSGRPANDSGMLGAVDWQRPCLVSLAGAIGRGGGAAPAWGPSGQWPIRGRRETISLPFRTTSTSS